MGKSREHRRRGACRAGAATQMPPAYPPSPSSTSSSDFEFTVSLSPTSRRAGAANLCPADELFYKGQLLPLHISPRISMVTSLLLASSSSSSCSDSVTTASRDSSGSSNDSTVSACSADGLVLGAGECDSSRPSSVTEEEDAGRVVVVQRHHVPHRHHHHKYYSLASLATRFSSVFHRKKDASQQQQREDDCHVAAPAAQQVPLENMGSGNSDEAAATLQTRISSSTSSGRKGAGSKSGASGASASSAKEVFKKYVKKVKPLYEKLDQKLSALQQHRSHQQQQQQQKAAARQELRKKTFSFSVRRGNKSAMERIIMSASASRKERDLQVEVEEEPRGSDGGAPLYANASFSGNLRHLRRRQSADSAASCPSSMRSSPSHSGLLYPRQRGSGAGGSRSTAFVDASPASAGAFPTYRFHPSSWPSSSSMEELQSAIQGAIAHCKSTMAAQSTNQKDLSTPVSERIPISSVPTESPTT